MAKNGAHKVSERGRRIRNFAGFIRFLLFLALLCLLAGFVVFARSVSVASAPDPMPSADGIVVLTGGAGRMARGGALLAQGYAERLLVSGVDQAVSQDDLLSLLNVNEDLLSCCVDIDNDALDTVGNARETAIWASALGYEHIILVTSDYHMARSKLEISAATGGIRITAVPVTSDRRSKWWKDPERLGLFWREYAKLLVIYLRETGERPEHPPQPMPSPAEIMRKSQEPPKLTGPKDASPNNFSDSDSSTDRVEQEPVQTPQ